MNIPVSEAKAKFSEIVRRAEGGEEIVLTRNGKAVARMMPGRPKRRLGQYRGQFWMAPDFDDLGPEWDAYVK